MRTNAIKQMLKEYFFINPTSKLRIREIERKVGIALPSAIRYCKEFTKEGILSVLKIGNVTFYTANRANEKFLLEKKLFNIKQLYASGFVKYLRHELSNPAVMVFGSFAKGEDTEESDIDLYIETNSANKINLEKFEKNLGKRFQIFKHKNLKELSNPHLADAIINGIVLNGFVRVFT